MVHPRHTKGRVLKISENLIFCIKKGVVDIKKAVVVIKKGKCFSKEFFGLRRDFKNSKSFFWQ
jgi:hypothetical protein